MAWAWVKQMYPWTLCYSDYVTPPNFPSGGTAKNRVVAGTVPITPISKYTPNLTKWQIASNFYVEISVNGNNVTTNVFGGGSLIFGTTWNLGSGETMYLGFVMDTSAQRAALVTAKTFSSWTVYYWGDFSSQTDSQRATLYPYVKAAADVQTPDWHAVNSVSGELGTFEFSKIAQEHINDGNAVTTTDPTYIERFIGSTEIGQMVRNLAPGQQPTSPVTIVE